MSRTKHTGAAKAEFRPDDILVCGDNHGEFSHIVEAALRLESKAVISVGDIQPERPLEVELAPLIERGIAWWWVPGNHDCDSQADYEHTFGSALADRNLHGRVAQIGPYRVAGLGGVFRQDIWGPPTTFETEAMKPALFFHAGGELALRRLVRLAHRRPIRVQGPGAAPVVFYSLQWLRRKRIPFPGGTTLRVRVPERLRRRVRGRREIVV